MRLESRDEIRAGRNVSNIAESDARLNHSMFQVTLATNAGAHTTTSLTDHARPRTRAGTRKSTASTHAHASTHASTYARMGCGRRYSRRSALAAWPRGEQRRATAARCRSPTGSGTGGRRGGRGIGAAAAAVPPPPSLPPCRRAKSRQTRRQRNCWRRARRPAAVGGEGPAEAAEAAPRALAAARLQGEGEGRETAGRSGGG